MAQTERIATVFGGTGFLGWRIAQQLAGQGWDVRVAVRHPDRVSKIDNVVGVQADIRDELSVAAAVRGAAAVVNAVSLYVERGGKAPSFRAVHEDGAARVASLAASCGSKRVVHISGIGADAGSQSRFISARGRGEDGTKAGFSGATVIRPSVMFGDGDRFMNSLADILFRSPVFPLIGGNTRLQPVHADDVAALVTRLLDRDDGRGETFELGGPDILTMRELVEWLLETLNIRRVIVPIPIPLALIQARVLELLPSPPLTVSQVELLRKDNVVSGRASGFDRVGIRPASIKQTVPTYVCKR